MGKSDKGSWERNAGGLPWPAWLSRAWVRLGWGADAESISGDLTEALDQRRAAGGSAVGAWFWGWRQVLRTGLHGLRPSVRQDGVELAGASVDRARRSSASSPFGLHPLLALRLAARGLQRDRATSFAVVGILALGLAAPTTFFSLLWGGGMRPLPVPDGDQIVRIDVTNPRSSAQMTADLQDVRALSQATVFDGLGAYESRMFAVRTDQWGTLRIYGAAMTPGSFELLGVPPLLGVIPNGEGTPALVLGHGFWRDQMASDPSVIGADVHVDGVPHVIAAVMPEGFGFPIKHHGWTVIGPEDTTVRLSLFARLSDDASLEAASDQVTTRWRQRDELRPADMVGAVGQVKPYTSARGEAGEAIVFFGLVLVGMALLVIASVNAANLLMVRAIERLRSLSVQSALGAARAQIGLQLLVEALLLTSLGGLLGLGITHLLIERIQETASANFGYYWMRMAVELPVVLFTVVLVIGTAVVAGTIPIVRVLRSDLQRVLKQGAGATGRRSIWEQGLVSLQLGLSAAALVAAGLASQSIRSASNFGDEIAGDEIVIAQMNFPIELLGTEADRTAARAGVIEKMAALPGARFASVSLGAPGFQEPSLSFEILGAEPDPEIRWRGLTNAVSLGFFQMYEISPTRGRGLSPSDDANAPLVAVVNEAWVDRFSADQNPLGRAVRIAPYGEAAFEIVGVVETLPMGLGDIAPEDRIYLALEQIPVGPVFLSIRRVDPTGLVPAMRRAVAEVHPDLALPGAMTLAEAHDFMTRAQKTFSQLAAWGGYAGLLVAAVGLYAILAFGVRQRRREMGVRMAMGADGGRLAREVIGSAMRQVIPAMMVGLALSWLAAPGLSVILLGNSARSIPTFLAVAAVFVTVGVIAALLPALDASRVEPADVLRSE